MRDQKVRTILFTEEYGKITGWEEKVSCGDIGSKVEVLIERKSGFNKIKRMTILSSVFVDTWNYDEVIEYLSFIRILYEALPEGGEQKNIFRFVQSSLLDINTIVGKVGYFILLQSTVLKGLGYLSEEKLTFKNKNVVIPDIRFILSMKSMPKTYSFPDEFYQYLKKGVHEARHQYLIRI